MYYSFALAGHRGTCLRPLHIFALLFAFVLVDVGLTKHALNAPIFTFVQPILERNDRVSFNDVAWQFVPYIHHTLIVEEFPDVETTLRLIQLVSTKVMVILAQYKKIVSVDVLFPCQYFIRFNEISSDSSVFQC